MRLYFFYSAVPPFDTEIIFFQWNVCVTFQGILQLCSMTWNSIQGQHCLSPNISVALFYQVILRAAMVCVFVTVCIVSITQHCNKELLLLLLTAFDLLPKNFNVLMTLT